MTRQQLAAAGFALSVLLLWSITAWNPAAPPEPAAAPAGVSAEAVPVPAGAAVPPPGEPGQAAEPAAQLQTPEPEAEDVGHPMELHRMRPPAASGPVRELQRQCASKAAWKPDVNALERSR